MAQYDDPRILRAIAHPTRNRVLHELGAVGSLRAADVAERLGIPANQASFHLRQLHKYGLIEEDPEATGDRRSRAWRLADPRGVSFSTREMAAQPGGPEAVKVFTRSALAHGIALVESAHADPTGPKTPQEYRSITDLTLLLNQEQGQQLEADLLDVFDRYLEAGRAHANDPDWIAHTAYLLVQPTPD